MTITRTSGRPYPNVRRARQSQGWEATHPTNGKQKYLGTFPTPEGAGKPS